MALIAIAASVAVYGCGGGGREYRLGRQAEERGDSSRAYDEYCRAGTRSRSGSVSAALERVAPGAADEAESAALAAMDEGRYDDAWRLLMRTLDIMPNHPNVPELIRRIEAEHPAEITAVKTDYLRRGSTALVKGMPDRPILAAAAPTRRKLPPKPDVASPQPEIKAATSESSRNFKPGVVKQAEVGSEKMTREMRPAPALKPETPKPQKMKPVPPKQSPPVRELPRGVMTAPRTTRSSSSTNDEGGFLIVHTLSKRDRRYPRITKTMEGITLKLRDTDDDGEVDMDIFDGKRRIKKVRDLEPGDSQTFRGKSGEVYRMTLLGVHHKSHTVRVGIKPA